MRWTLNLLSLMGGVLTMLMTTSASALNIETLVMPGKVIEGHADLEEDCKNCHSRGREVTQDALCRDCHEEVDADVIKRRGFHGRIKNINRTECRTCHTDHKGRGADIIGLDKETFDHRLTDFRPKGAHTRTPCNACHLPDKLFREAPGQCIDCHKEDDVHKGRLGEKCKDCHDENGWKKTAEFDHDETEFPLEGSHKEVACDSCHPNERYKKTPTVCQACHALNDAHGGRFGVKCDTCHTPDKWDRVTFDHNRDTDWHLTGAHRDVKCSSCHRGHLYDDDAPRNCFGCHQKDDEHRGRNGKQCSDCHSPQSWKKTAFNHDRDTDFPLRGKHTDLRCESCHRGELSEELDTNCFGCHRQDDVHQGQEGERCQRCHNEEGWGENVLFDHDLTRFPLIGLHATTPCEECHLSAAYKEAALQCLTCHEADDIHEMRLGANCQLCHNPNGWALWNFDHNTQTDFKLEGEHFGLDCHACHKVVIKDKIELPDTCISCHRQDDKHQGRFGEQCDKCHDSETFSNPRIN